MTSFAEPNANRLIRAPKTAELIAAQIRGQIARKELVAGTTLPSETDLMTQLGVSRPTLREAFRILETESLISVRRGVGGGAMVLAPDIAVATRYFGVLLELADATIADVYEARTALEPVCAAMMAGRGDRQANQALVERIDQVAELLGGRTDTGPDPREWAQTTYLVHDQILQGSGNTTLALQGGLLAEVVAIHYSATRTKRPTQAHHPRQLHRVVMSFRKLSRLVEAGDADGAHQHWLKHMQIAAATLLGDDLKNKRVVDLFSD